MLKLSKKYNITVRLEDMPKNILGIYIEVFDKPYIILNDMLHSEMHDFIFYSCLYFKGKETAGKITMQNMEQKDFMPFIFANKMREKYVI